MCTVPCTNSHECRQRAQDKWLQYWTHSSAVTAFSSKAVTAFSFKSAQLFLPSKVNEMLVWSTPWRLSFLDNSSILNGLKEELLSYLAKAEDVQVMENTAWSLLWWKKHAEELPTEWSASAACQVALVQPSSATAECVFSLLKALCGPWTTTGTNLTGSHWMFTHASVQS